MSFYWQGRFNEKPSDILKHYYADEMRLDWFLEALHVWDKAQVVVLSEQSFAPSDAVEALVRALAAMESEGVVAARAGQWNVVHGGEEYMRKHCDEYAKDADKLAADAERFAEFHRMRAEEMRGK